MSSKVAEIVRDQVIEGLKQGDVPWQRPWVTRQCRNFASGHQYRGINPWMLEIACHKAQWPLPLFASYNQVEGMGGQVKKGEHGTMVVFLKEVEKRHQEDEEPETYYLLRYYRVFNIAQTEGIPPEKYAKYLPQTIEHDVIAEAEAVITRTGARIIPGGRASYTMIFDTIEMPPLATFADRNEYYLTTFHELTHWTGHPSRLDRLQDGAMGKRTDEYSFEELIAEIGANIISFEVGIVSEVKVNSQAYINGWLKKIAESDPGWIIRAAAQSDKAAEFILQGGK